VRVRFFFFAREAAGASSIRHSLRPLSFEGARNSWQTSGAWRREIADLCPVIASASEAIQNLSGGAILDCFVASAPRNDGAGCLKNESTHSPSSRP
jgi:hypothetical protein